MPLFQPSEDSERRSSRLSELRSRGRIAQALLFPKIPWSAITIGAPDTSVQAQAADNLMSCSSKIVDHHFSRSATVVSLWQS